MSFVVFFFILEMAGGGGGGGGGRDHLELKSHLLAKT